MKIIDFHTHAFPDNLAEKAINSLKTYSPDSKPYHNGTIKGLLESMDKAGIYASVIQSIATKPSQMENILNWSIQIKSERIIPFISLHPEGKNFESILKKAKENDIKGVKIHPHYQNFYCDDKKVFPIYEIIAHYGLIAFFHAGVDLAFPGMDNASPERLLKVRKEFPELIMVLAHGGSYREWDKVYDLLCGKEFYFEISFILKEAGSDMFKKILNKHSEDLFLFGTDSPWNNQKEEALLLEQVKIPDRIKEKIFYLNAERLLNQV